MKQLVTVIVPVYNVKDYLVECVNSIQRQIYSNLEIILIDDGSTDGSGEICEKLKKKDSRIQVIHKQNGGLPSARNTGIEAAKGEYIAFVDSDDTVDEKYIHNQLALIQSTGADFVVSGFFYNENGKVVGYNVPTEKCILDREHSLRAFLFQKAYMNSACNKLFDIHLFKEIRFPEGMIYEDFATLYRLIDYSKKIAFLPEPLYFYRSRSGSIMQSDFSIKNLQLITHAEHIYSFIEEHYPHLKSSAAYCVMYCCFTLLRRMIYAKHRYYHEEQKLRAMVFSYCEQIPYRTLTHRDKVGLLTLKMGISFFKAAWSIRSYLQRLKNKLR